MCKGAHTAYEFRLVETWPLPRHVAARDEGGTRCPSSVNDRGGRSGLTRSRGVRPSNFIGDFLDLKKNELPHYGRGRLIFNEWSLAMPEEKIVLEKGIMRVSGRRYMYRVSIYLFRF